MLLCRFCPFMISSIPVSRRGGGARGLSLMYCLLIFISFGHIPIPFYTDSKADKPPAGWQFFFSFRLFFSYHYFILFSFLLFSPSLCFYLPSSPSCSLPFDSSTNPNVVRTYCSAGAQRKPGAPVGFPDKLLVGACVLAHQEGRCYGRRMLCYAMVRHCTCGDPSGPDHVLAFL